MKDIINIKNTEQLEMLADPFSLEIMDIMGEKELTVDQIVESTGSPVAMIEDYLEKMVELELMVLKKDEKGVIVYQMAALNFEAREVVYQADTRYRTDFVLGFINHLQNQLLDLFKYIYDREDPAQFLSELGFSDNPVVSKNSVYLKPEEAEEFTRLVMDYINDKSTEERRTGEEYRAYDVFHFLFPAIQDIKTRSREK